MDILNINIKYIIVNADDFGLNSFIDECILKLCSKNRISNISVMVAGEAFCEDIDKLKVYSGLGTGIHLCLTDEKPISKSNEIETLIEKDGNLKNYNKLVYDLIQGKLDLKEVYIEWKAQIDKFINTGLKPAHLDTHKHLHLFPVFFDILINLAKEYNISAVRNLKNCNLANYKLSFANIAKIMLLIIFNNNYDELTSMNIYFPDETNGFYDNKNIEKQNILDCFQKAVPGRVTELICHPGSNLRNCKLKYANMSQSCEKETDTFDNLFNEVVNKYNNIKIINYRDLINYKINVRKEF